MRSIRRVAMMHISVKEPRRTMGRVTHSNRMKVPQPMRPTLTPFSMVLRLLTLREWNTERSAIARVHTSTKRARGMIMSAISMSMGQAFCLVSEMMSISVMALSSIWAVRWSILESI